MSRVRPAPSQRAGSPQGRRGLAPERVGEPELPARAVPRQLPARPRPSLSAGRKRSGPEFTAFYHAFREFLKHEVDPVEIDRTGRVPARGRRRAAQAGRLRDEDPEGVRRARLQHARVPEADGAAGQRRRQRRGAALRAPVDRRAAAADLLRQRGAEAPIPAALRRRRDLRLRPHRARRRLRPGAAGDHRRALGGRRATTCSTAPSSGARTARSPSCWWSWPAIRRRRRSAPSWSRPRGRA